MIRRLVILCGAAIIAACSLNVEKLRGAPPNLYDISPQMQTAAKRAPVAWQLEIEEPLAPTVLDTDRVMVRLDAHEINYIARARWSDRAPRLVQSKLVEAFERSGAIVGVGRQAIGLRSDYTLKGELRAFEGVYDGGAPVIHIALSLKLVRQRSADIVAARTFDRKLPAASNSISAITATFEQALGEIMDEAVPWTLDTGEADYAAHLSRSRERPAVR